MSARNQKRLSAWCYAPSQIKFIPGFNKRQKYVGIEGLADSIAANGLRRPLRGYDEKGFFMVTDGHRRSKAIDLLVEQGRAEANVQWVPVIIEDRMANEVDFLYVQLTDNDEMPLEPLEQGLVIRELVNLGATVDTIAKRWGKGRSYVDDRLKLAWANPEAQEVIGQGIIAPGVAADLLEEVGTGTAAAEILKAVKKDVEQRGATKATANDVKRVKAKLEGREEDEALDRDAIISAVRSRKIDWSKATDAQLRQIAAIVERVQRRAE